MRASVTTRPYKKRWSHRRVSSMAHGMRLIWRRLMGASELVLAPYSAAEVYNNSTAEADLAGPGTVAGTVAL